MNRHSPHSPPVAPMVHRARCLACLLACVCVLAASGTEVIRQHFGKGSAVVLRDGNLVFLECTPPGGSAAKAYLAPLLALPDTWSRYAGKGAVAIPISALNTETQRDVLLALFPDDVVNEDGWQHVAVGQGENMEALARWLTGEARNARLVARENKRAPMRLSPGERISVPRELLLDLMRKPTPERVVKPAEKTSDEATLDLSAAAEALTYTEKDGKQYAVYHLKEGEALYTSVVVRFTDIEENAYILKACETLQKVSGIRNVRAMKPGTSVLIPVEMLSDRFKPEDSPGRQHYEEIIQEAERLREQVRGKGLDGVIVVLDPGHGGRDHGASNKAHRLYEDELSFDMVCRVKRLLEKDTGAKVYLTLRDPSSPDYAPTDRTRFEHDTDEELLTTPTTYKNRDATVSANLRWYLANAIFRKEVAAGVDPNKIIFTSFHCDALFDSRMRGAMMYVPGARYRPGAPGRSREGRTGREYGGYDQVKEQRYVTFSERERMHDEAISRTFAQTLYDELGKKRIRRHLEKNPIRSVIRQDGGKVYVPAVLRCNMIPTKILVETANMTNDTDCTRLADPEWRQWFAEAYVNALKKHFGSPNGS